MDYPDSLPCVSRIDGFAMNSAAAVLRTPFDAGNTRQRRLHKMLPTEIALAWRVRPADLHPLMQWLNEHGFDWFNLRLAGVAASELGVFATPIPVRLISDIRQQLMRFHRENWWTVTALAEYQPWLISEEATPEPVTLGWFAPPWSPGGDNAATENAGTDSDRIAGGETPDLYFGLVGGGDTDALVITPEWTPVGSDDAPVVTSLGFYVHVQPAAVAAFDYGEGTLDITATLDGVPAVGRLRVVFAGSEYQSITWSWHAE